MVYRSTRLGLLTVKTRVCVGQNTRLLVQRTQPAMPPRPLQSRIHRHRPSPPPQPTTTTTNPTRHHHLPNHTCFVTGLWPTPPPPQTHASCPGRGQHYYHHHLPNHTCVVTGPWPTLPPPPSPQPHLRCDGVVADVAAADAKAHSAKEGVRLERPQSLQDDLAGHAYGREVGQPATPGGGMAAQRLPSLSELARGGTSRWDTDREEEGQA